MHEIISSEVIILNTEMKNSFFCIGLFVSFHMIFFLQQIQDSNLLQPELIRSFATPILSRSTVPM